MKLKAALKKLEGNKIFVEWKSKNKHSFLSYAMKMSDNDQWQLGYYQKATDKITTFLVDDQIEMVEEAEIFKKPDMKVNPIDIQKAKLSLKDIITKVLDFQKKQYPKELVNKKICILQNLESYSTIWNITLLTQAFSTINLKVDPESGKIIDYKLDSLASFVKK